MKKDEIIELLKEQIKGLRDDNNRLLDQIDALIKEVSSLKEALLQKGESLGKQQRLTKGIAKLVSNTSEQQQPPQPALPEEERQKREAKQISVKPERTMGPNVACIMRWSRRNMTFIPTILILTSITPGWLPSLPEYVSAMNVYPCASSSTSTRYTPMRKTVVSLREKHRSRLS